ncbi:MULTISPECIES: restriction endonuclease subunit S [Providencia]|uniref:Restriction endonuclease subunit S n=1 Tax=Providencia rettgeri TaxID=587 RepID=A0AAD2VVV1_PRORE|nr:MULTISPECIES: restriction endonuclease subunit S [Providencia]EIL1983233.1 restriction endonuclease subunit S [Providencia rettgeri]EIU7557770.1 restriction endonuclease subunit S [Providencia rettgeri]ELR5058028.1 restriction endonuclease subunit S [Providencia rettgeri]ELR5087467.1 restriction endonuclease subunit S [Providencia rettgeri]ELR5219810.1 restriction endonuclease subunit S [Providencia rettgeri]
MVPNGWEETRLKHIARIKSGSTPLRAKQDLYYSQDGTPWVKTLDLNNAEIFETDERITELALKETSCSIFPVNTVLVAMYGGFNQIGRTGLLTVPSAINQALSGLMLDGTKADSKYILNYLNGNVRQWKKFAASSRKDPNITREDVCNFEVLLPPLPEQRKIAKILSTWDNAIATTEKLIATSQQQKKALMQQLLTGKKRLVDPDTGKVFEGKWEEVKLDDLALYRRGSFPQPYGNPEWVDEVNGYPFIQVFDIDKNMKLKKATKTKISDAAIDKSVFIEAGTVIVSLQGSIGRVAITQYDAYVDRTVLLFQSFKRKMDTIYFAYAIQELFEIEKEKAPGGTIKTITKQVLSNFTIKVPTHYEQQKIASVLTAADKEIELLQAKLAHLKDEKKALMQQLLTGKRRVKVDENVAA